MKLTNRKLVCKKLSSNFREATELVTVELDLERDLPADCVCVQQLVLGINASDINYTAGKYFADPKSVTLPFDCGFESLGKVIQVGSAVKRLKPGDFVIVTQDGSFAEFVIAKEKVANKIPVPAPVSGLTASIALEEAGEMKQSGGETVLKNEAGSPLDVTAAAGATGLYAVQLAKLAGNHVIATCSSDDKVDFLKKLGCDRVINYKKENLNKVLSSEYPNGINIVYESVGGDTFVTCVKNLAKFGRLIVIGAISQYQAENAPGMPSWVPLALIKKSATIRGFFLPNSTKKAGEHIKRLFGLFQEGKLKVPIDQTNFTGLESIADAIDYLYSGKNIGKVVVHLNNNTRKSKL